VADFGRTFRRAAGGLEDLIGGAWRKGRRSLGFRPPSQIVPYFGYGRPERLILKGRVVVRRDLPPPGKADTRWRNFRSMFRRYMTDEIPGAKIELEQGGQRFESITDGEGYFDLDCSLSLALPTSVRWHEIPLNLRFPLGRQQSEVRTSARILTPSPDAQFGVISDIDDTVIHTGATNFFRMARVVMFGNAYTRLAFKGVAAFYQALQMGCPSDRQNPIFYVTSSPWNIFDVICEVFRVHEIPLGPIFMKDYGFDETKFIKSSHGSHKLARIRELLEFYPELPFVLIGDSGQHDPEIYRQIVREYPERIRAIYIRDITTRPERRAAVEALGREVSKAGSALVLSEDTMGAARHAAEAGLIEPAQLERIAKDKQQDSAEPTAAERLLNQQT